jgi:hypothetical protein
MDSSASSYLVNDYLSICQKKWGVYIASVPSRCIVSGLVLARPSQRHTFLDVFPHIFGFSMACDLVTIAVLRLLFTAISSAVSVGQIAFIISVLFSIALLLLCLPPLFIVTAFFNHWSSYGTYQGEFFILLNVPTAAAGLLPMIVLIFLLAHRITWPLLGRAIYSLCKFKIISNRKALVACGSLALTYAFDVSPVGFKDILKLFS